MVITLALYDEIKNLPNHPEKLLIDVRDAAEIHQTGAIPTSINIPLCILKRELQLDNDDFYTKYKKDKPFQNSTVIFSCRTGMRARKAAEHAKNLGFNNLKVYIGSWSEWERKLETNNENQQPADIQRMKPKNF